MKSVLVIIILLIAQLCTSAVRQDTPGSLARAKVSGGAGNAGVSTATVICIDPGHPSEVSAGKEVQNGTTEVRVAWEVALKLKKILEAEGYRVVLTKSAEAQLVENKERALVANRVEAALMVRLHCDASADEGFAVYHPDRQGTAQNLTGPSARVIEESRNAAARIHEGMLRGLGGVLKDGGVRGDSKTLVGSRQGALTGSIFSEVPVVTIEMVVLSNEEDAEFIKDERGQQEMAQAIAEGIGRYVGPVNRATPRSKKLKN